MPTHTHAELDGAKYVVVADRARHYIDCTDNVAALVGYERSELLSMKIDELSFDQLCLNELFERYQSYGHQDGEYILKHKDGTPVLVHYKAWVFDDGCHAATWEPAEEWEQLYISALLEESPVKIPNKVNRALHAIKSHQLTPTEGEHPDKLRNAYEILCTISA